MKRMHSLRFRMMLLFCVVVGLLLAGSYLGFYLLLRRQVYAQLDLQLANAAKPLVADLIADAADPGDRDVDELDVPGQYFELLAPSGSVLQRSRNLQARPLDVGSLAPGLSKAALRSLRDPQLGSLRLGLFPFHIGERPLLLAVALPTGPAQATLRRFRRLIFILLPLGLLLTALVSSWYVGRSLAPVSEFTREAARRVEPADHFQRSDLFMPIPVPETQDELASLAETFNRLFQRIGSVVEQMNQFVSDAAHELRTPLTVLQGETELLLSRPRSAEEYRKALRINDEELKKLSRIVQALFTLALADNRQLQLAREPVYLDEILEEACTLVLPEARAREIEIDRDLMSEVLYHGDEAFLRQLFLIFLDNALKFSDPRTRIRVTLEKPDSRLRIRFGDQGSGISDQDLPHIFERFYRGQNGAGAARSGGLGLAIARALVQAMSGSIECRSEPGRGSTFTITLPADDGSGTLR